VRRLFSTFAHGPPGAGLLLMRLAAGVGLVAQAAPALLAGLPLGPALLQVFSTSLGILLLAGLWTPIVGALVAVEALWNVYSSGHPWVWIMLATLGAALALIGPGAWSMDARLFGWKRFEIRDPKSQDSPPHE
jgi:hypothetical protein